ncbi:MAG: dynamin family protein [Deltaproteobacteria bacterium]|nr:dynamin family protein [Deltaproteobacteria bacterium]MBW2317089.1 dynamin family protein [Deltaproteobacteria bacterium]
MESELLGESPMYRENYINSLRAELVEMVADYLTPVAMRYGYSDVPLEANIKWRPQVLVLGNYSSGKSTMINEFLNADVQATGQAPTDDSFTIITYDDSESDSDNIHVTETRDGKFLLNNPEYPFEALKKHGQRFASHFRLKKVNSPFLKSLALIDTPGMLDSITERDRGYNYQEVIGDLAQIADLVLIVFDPHKAGTVREAYISIRETLPSYIFEHQLLFVLNRIDECNSLTDLLRVYGTLCWNLSQITGRKDIPMIHLTYSPRATSHNESRDGEMKYLNYLENQREELRRAILEAPRYRLDHLASFVETHGERLAHMLEALVNYRKRLIAFRFKCGFTGFLISLLCGGIAVFAMLASPVFAVNQLTLLAGGAGLALAAFFFWLTVPLKYFGSKFHRNQLKDFDDLTPLGNQTRRDTWGIVRNMTYDYIKKTAGRFSFREAKRGYITVSQICDKGSKDIREALNELAKMGDKGLFGDVEFPFSRKSEQQDEKEKAKNK